MQRLTSASNELTSTDKCASLLMEVVPSVMHSIRDEMRRHRVSDLTMPQFRALIYLGRHPSSTLSIVAEHLGLSLAATSRLIDGLVARHAVERESSSTDRRCIALNVTEQGRSTLESVRQAARAGLSARLEALSPNDQESLVLALETLREAFGVGISSMSHYVDCEREQRPLEYDNLAITPDTTPWNTRSS